MAGAIGVFQDRTVLRGDKPSWMCALGCYRQPKIMPALICSEIESFSTVDYLVSQ
jgi:hypothetical protein